MLKNVTLGRYYPGQSVLHGLDPRTKTIASLAYMIVVFIAQTPLAILLLVTATIALALVSRVPVKILLGSLKPVLLILIFAFAINLFTVRGNPLVQLGPLTISDQGLALAIRMAIRLVLLILGTSLFLTLTTTPILIADAMERLLSPLRRVRFPVHEMAMMMSIALRFVPTLLEETDKIMKAQSSRGADYDTGGPITKAKGLVSVLIPLFVSAFKRAEDLALAMEARCYRGGEGRTRLKVMRYRRMDLVFAIAFLAIAALIIVIQYVPALNVI